jgi:hypothetical protein
MYRNQEVAIKVLKETPTAEQLVEFQKARKKIDRSNLLGT